MEPKKISDNVTLYSADPIVYVVNNFYPMMNVKLLLKWVRVKWKELR